MKSTERERPSHAGGNAQLLRAGLEICLLSLIAERDRYGYELVKTLEERGFPLGNGRSVYPALKRMEGDGRVAGYLVRSTDGPARRYYSIRPGGTQDLAARVPQFDAFVDAVRGILFGGSRGNG